MLGGIPDHRRPSWRRRGSPLRACQDLVAPVTLVVWIPPPPPIQGAGPLPPATMDRRFPLAETSLPLPLYTGALV
jgi:hypothetical protein